MKKILFITNFASKDKQENKITSFSRAAYEAALELGYEFHINTNNEDTLPENGDDKAIYHKVAIYRNPFSLDTIKAYWDLKRLCKREQFDIIHCNTPVGGVVGRLAGKRCRIPHIIYQAHGFHFYKGAPFINRTIFKWAEMVLAHFTDVLITINKEDYEAAKKFKLRKNGKVFYIPGVGIDTVAYKTELVIKKKLKNSLGLKDTDIICISMGDLIPRKNYKAAIEAIAKCDNYNIHYLICGAGQDLAELQKLASDAGVSGQIHFLGFRRDIKELLHIADIFLFTTFQEGLPRSMMEAMASGLPCIASKIRGNEDLLDEGKGGYLVPPDDIDMIAQKIQQLAEDSELCQKMADYNLSRILDFDTKNIKKNIIDVYEKTGGG